MNEEQWEAYLNDIMDRQINATRNQSVIFTVSLSNTQVRVFIEPLGQKCQEYFIYRKATDETAQKVIKKIDDFLANMKVWQGFKNKTT